MPIAFDFLGKGEIRIKGTKIFRFDKYLRIIDDLLLIFIFKFGINYMMCLNVFKYFGTPYSASL